MATTSSPMDTTTDKERKQVKRKVQNYEKEQKQKEKRIEKYKKHKTEIQKRDKEMADASILSASEWLDRLPLSQLMALVKRFDPNPPDLKHTTKELLCTRLAYLNYITLEGIRYFYTAKYGNVLSAKDEAKEYEASLVDMWYKQTYEWLRVGELFNVNVDGECIGDRPVTKRFIVANKSESKLNNKDDSSTIQAYTLSTDEFNTLTQKRHNIEHFPVPINRGRDFIRQFTPTFPELFNFKFSCNEWVLTNGYNWNSQRSSNMPYWSEGKYSISMKEFAYMHIMRFPLRCSPYPLTGCPDIGMHMTVLVRCSHPTAIRKESAFVFHLGYNKYTFSHKLRCYDCTDSHVVNLATSQINTSLQCIHFKLTTRNGIVRFTAGPTTDLLTGRSCTYELDLHDIYRVDNRAITHALVGLTKPDGNSLNATFKSNQLFDKNTLDMMIDYVKSDDWSTMPLTDYRKGDGWITKPVAK